MSLDFNFEYSGGFLPWLKNNNCSFIFSSYKTHVLYSFGLTVDKRDNMEKLSIWITNFSRPTGICVENKDTLWLATVGNIWKVYNCVEEGDVDDDGFDATYVPRIVYNTGNIDAHDLTLAGDKIIFCNTKFSCISTVSQTENFHIEYTPPWISKLACEDRCHLNGLCVVDDELTYVTSVSQSDIHDGWRNKRKDRGIVFNVKENKVVCRGLSMPHSPKLYKGKLWVLNSGSGEFGYIEDEQFNAITFIPGFIRGLDFIGNYAVIGASQDRHEKRFQDLELGEKLEEHEIESRCGIFVVDIKTGDIVHNITFNDIKEIYDVRLLPGVKRPRVLDINDEKTNDFYRFDRKIKTPSEIIKEYKQKEKEYKNSLKSEKKEEPEKI